MRSTSPRHLPPSSTRALLTTGDGSPPLLLWSVPWLVVVELVGSTYGTPLAFSVGYFSLVLAMLLLRRRVALFAPPERIRRVLGWCSLLFGIGLLAALLPTSGALLREDVDLPLALSGCWFVVLGLAWGWARKLDWPDLERLGLLLGLAFLVLLGTGHRVQRLPVFPEGDWASLGLCAAALVLVVLLASAGRRQPERLMLLLAVGVLIRAGGLFVWEPHPNVRDMLPLVGAAGDALARGTAPYDLYQMQDGSVVPLTYLPGLWLLHNLPRLLMLPLRATSVAADVAIVMSLWWAAGASSRVQLPRARSLALGLGAVWLFSPSVQWNAIYAEPHPWWGLMALLVAAALNGRWRVSAILLGISIATRQFAWALAPLWFAWAFQRLGARQALFHALLAGAAALLLLVPFVAGDPDAFWFGTFRWFVDYGSAHRSWFVERLGFAGTLYAVGKERWLLVLQALTLAVALMLAFRCRERGQLLAVMAAGYTAVVMFSPVIWNSFYLGVFVLVSLAVIGQDTTPAHAPVRVPRATSRHRLLALGAAAEGALVLWLAHSFWSMGTEAGLTQAADSLRAQAGPGDVLVERARHRVAFIQPNVAIAPLATAHVVSDAFDASLPDLGWFTAPRLGLLARRDRDSERVAQLAQLGASHADGAIGAYRWLIVEPSNERGLLSDSLTAATFHARSDHSIPLSSETGARYRTNAEPNFRVERRRCFIGGRRRWMLHANPSQRGSFELVFSKPGDADRLALVAGFEDAAVRYGRAEVSISGLQRKAPRGEFRVKNLPGLDWRVFTLSRGDPHLSLLLETADDRQRWLCLEGIWY